MVKIWKRAEITATLSRYCERDLTVKSVRTKILDQKSHPRGRLTLEPSRVVFLAWRFREVKTANGELIAGGGNFTGFGQSFEDTPVIYTTADTVIEASLTMIEGCY